MVRKHVLALGVATAALATGITATATGTAEAATSYRTKGVLRT